MPIHWFRRPAVLGLGATVILAAVPFGCGGQPSDSSTAVVVPPANSLATKATGPEAAPAAGAAAAGSASSTATTAPVKAEGWGTLRGQVVFGGDPPPAAILQDKGKAAKDPEICAKDAPIKSEKLVIGDGKGVKFALVYLPRPTAVNDQAKSAAEAKKIAFDQKGCVFEPHVLGLMANVPITLKSSDPVSHNVNIKLKASTSSNQTISGGQSVVFTPTAKENTPGQVVCDIHPWMTAWWMVVDNPYITVTDDKGYFELKNVPAGTQKVVVWQEAVANRGFVTPPSGEDVTIKANDTTVKDFTIEPGKLLPAS